MEAVSAFGCEKEDLSPWCCLCSSFKVWLEWEDAAPCDAGLIILGLGLFLDLSVLNPRCLELHVRELQQVFVIAGGVVASATACP